MWATSTGKENPKHNPGNNGTGKYWHFLCNHSWPEQHEFIRPWLYCYCFPVPSFRWKWADRPSVHLRRKLLCFPVKLGGQSQTTRTLFDSKASYFYLPPSALQLAFVFSMTLCLHIFSLLNTFSPFGSHLCDHLRAEYLGFFSCFVSAIVAFMFACGDALIKRHLRHGMTKDTCISISVLAKKPGSVVLPPLFKNNNKKVFFFYCVASLVSPPLRYIPASLHTKVLPQAACHLLLTFSE